jgi:hypothetical protein
MRHGDAEHSTGALGQDRRVAPVSLTPPESCYKPQQHSLKLNKYMQKASLAIQRSMCTEGTPSGLLMHKPKMVKQLFCSKVRSLKSIQAALVGSCAQ